MWYKLIDFKVYYIFKALIVYVLSLKVSYLECIFSLIYKIKYSYKVFPELIVRIVYFSLISN